jgi:hypothetical protein
MSHPAPWPRNPATGPQESLPHRTPGASSRGWATPPGTPAFLECIRLPGFGLPAGETEFPPPPEVLDRVLDGLRKLS